MLRQSCQRVACDNVVLLRITAMQAAEVSVGLIVCRWMPLIQGDSSCGSWQRSWSPAGSCSSSKVWCCQTGTQPFPPLLSVLLLYILMFMLRCPPVWFLSSERAVASVVRPLQVDCPHPRYVRPTQGQKAPDFYAGDLFDQPSVIMLCVMTATFLAPFVGANVARAAALMRATCTGRPAPEPQQPRWAAWELSALP